MRSVAGQLAQRIRLQERRSYRSGLPVMEMDFRCGTAIIYAYATGL